ncbi:hypothetical protein LV779_11815 [Streptomyces thinghirensis]|nr:hypothetical protein [Streptomyces thinghirensis]
MTVPGRTSPTSWARSRPTCPGTTATSGPLHALGAGGAALEDKRGIFLAGDDISWTAGWAEGAVRHRLNAVWGVMHHFGAEDPTRPTRARVTSTTRSRRSSSPRGLVVAG